MATSAIHHTTSVEGCQLDSRLKTTHHSLSEIATAQTTHFNPRVYLDHSSAASYKAILGVVLEQQASKAVTAEVALRHSLHL